MEFFGTGKFITFFKKTRYFSVSQYILTQSPSLHVFRFILIFYSFVPRSFKLSVSFRFLHHKSTCSSLFSRPYQLRFISDYSRILYLYQSKYVILTWVYHTKCFPKGAGICLLTIRFVPTMSVSQPSVQRVLAALYTGSDARLLETATYCVG